MKTVVVDTNFFIQCKGIDSLTWGALFDKNESINILVPRAVQKEVDNFKGQGKGRRAKKAKTANQLFGHILESENGYKLTDTVTLFFTPRKELARATPIPYLDASRNDDSILLEVLAYREIYPDSDAQLLTNDTSLMVSAKEYAVPYIRIPSDWLLDEEADEKDKTIGALRKEITQLKQSLPEISVKVNRSKETVTVKEFKPLTDSEINDLLDKFVEDEIAELQERDNSIYWLMRGTSPQLVEKFINKALPEWKEKSKKPLKSLHLDLHRKLNSSEIVFTLLNTGNFPAENIFVEISVSDNLVLFAPLSSENDCTALPTMPSAPAGSIVDIFKSMYAAENYRNAPLNHLMKPQIKNPHVFYWQGNSYSDTDPMTSVMSSCDEFRHQSKSETFSFLVSAKYGASVTGGTITFKVSARNLQKPISETVTISFNYLKGNTLSESYENILIPRDY